MAAILTLYNSVTELSQYKAQVKTIRCSPARSGRNCGVEKRSHIDTMMQMVPSDAIRAR